MPALIECVPNFSEGRDAARLEQIVAAMLAVPQVALLDQESDADHHRSVITLAGPPEAVAEAAVRGVGQAATLIDLTRHAGAHPRLGAADVVPFIPLVGATLEDCVRLAHWAGEEIWRRFGVPVYFYEAAARREDRRNLENIRRGQFEGVLEAVRTDPARRPDVGGPELHPTAGATVVGARKFLIAYNINLDTAELAVAKAIAKKVRASSGGLPCVKAMGVDLAAKGCAQVSMNLTDFETTSLATAWQAVAAEAVELGARAVESEIVGLIPRRALENAAAEFLRVPAFDPDLVLENRMARVLASGPARIEHQLTPFLSGLAAPTAVPGGGSAAAVAGAMAAALGGMVARLSAKKKALAAHQARLEALAAAFDGLQTELLRLADRDAEAYAAVVAARHLPAEDGAARERAVAAATEMAAEVPLATAVTARRVSEQIAAARPITAPAAASDLDTGAALAQAAWTGAVANVRINLESWAADAPARRRLEEDLRRLGA
ncbi:MAG: glutamate formimidoyltransferase [Terriglobales bacterium]